MGRKCIGVVKSTIYWPPSPRITPPPPPPPPKFLWSVSRSSQVEFRPVKFFHTEPSCPWGLHFIDWCFVTLKLNQFINNYVSTKFGAWIPDSSFGLPDKPYFSLRKTHQPLPQNPVIYFTSTHPTLSITLGDVGFGCIRGDKFTSVQCRFIVQKEKEDVVEKSVQAFS